MTTLRQQMDDAMLVRGFAERTRESYLAVVARLAKFYRRSPDPLTPEEVEAYLVHMLRKEQLAWSTCNLSVSAFRFLYHTTLKRPPTTFTVPGPKQPQKLPEILSPEEEQWLIASTLNRRQRVLLATAYAAGLGLSELVHLKVTDLDAQRMSLRLVRIRCSGAGEGSQGPLHPPLRPAVGGTPGLLAGASAPGWVALSQPRGAARLRRASGRWM